MKRIVLIIAAVLLVASHAAAELVSTRWDGSTLAMYWDDGDDEVRITTQNDLLWLSRNQDDPGSQLFTDDGQPIVSSQISLASFYLGGGVDIFQTSHFNANTAIVDAGPGNDFLNAPVIGNAGRTFLIGGPGTNDYEGDLSQDLFILGGPDQDTIIGGLGGLSYIDAGLGNNTIHGQSNTLTTYVHRPGATNTIADGGGNSIYILAPGTTPSNLYIFDFGGIDHLHKNGRSFTVNGTTINSPGITGQFHGWNNVQTVGIPEPSSFAIAFMAFAIAYTFRCFNPKEANMAEPQNPYPNEPTRPTPETEQPVREPEPVREPRRP